MNRKALRWSLLGVVVFLAVLGPVSEAEDRKSCEENHSMNPKIIRLRFDGASTQGLSGEIAVRLERHTEDITTTTRVTLEGDRIAWEGKFKRGGLSWGPSTKVVPYFRRTVDGGKFIDFPVLENYQCGWEYLPDSGDCIGDFFVHLEKEELEIQVVGIQSDWVVQGLSFAPSPTELRDRKDQLNVISSANCGVRLAVDEGEPVELRLGAKVRGKTIPLRAELERSRLRREGGAVLTREDFVTDRSSRRSGSTAQEEQLAEKLVQLLLARNGDLRIVESKVGATP